MKTKKVNYKKTGFMQGVLLLMLSQVVIKIIGLVYKLYITNKEGFGDRGNAIYSAGFQIYMLLLTLSSIGVPNAISKLVSAKVALGDNEGAYRIFKIAFMLFRILRLFRKHRTIFRCRTIGYKLLANSRSKNDFVSTCSIHFFSFNFICFKRIL